jgi:hypothetical protein
MPEPEPDFEAILRILAEHEVDFIVIGGVSAVLQGAPVHTFDLDVVHSRAPENLDRLLAALKVLDAYYREQPSRRLRPDQSHLSSAGHQLLTTRYGPLDLLGTVTGNRGYEDLAGHTIDLPLEEGRGVRLLDLATVILLKEETGRAKDKAVLPVLRQTLEERSKG